MTENIKTNEIVDLIEKLVNIPSPSGNTDKVITFTEQFCKYLLILALKRRQMDLLNHVI